MLCMLRGGSAITYASAMDVDAAIRTAAASATTATMGCGVQPEYKNRQIVVCRLGRLVYTMER